MRLKGKQKVATYILLVIGAFLVFFPILYALSISFMGEGEIEARRLIPSTFTLANYDYVLNELHLLTYLKNSVIVTIIITAAKLFTSCIAAYAFAFLRFKGKAVLFSLVISTMLIPGEVTVLPNFLTVQELGWINDIKGLTIPFFATAFGIFLLRQYFLTVPHELWEASRVEGMRHWGFLFKVVIPYCKSGLISLGLFEFISSWNMYLWPLLVTNEESARTVQIGIKQLQSIEGDTGWGVIMAAVILVILPALLLLFFGQKYLQKGLVQGATK
ncbi:carbohydrate ABC transporter permease [Brevibacillus sp. NRS-1366]|uniref:carbohydrate ABC transporter permease n=1 Tax=Brevibacillus sp. NRS-1366 TaxID=3233899 RepID=UPI003D2419AA